MQNEREQRMMRGFSRSIERDDITHSLSLDFFGINEIALDCLSLPYPTMMIYVNIYVKKVSYRYELLYPSMERKEIESICLLKCIQFVVRILTTRSTGEIEEIS